MEGPSGEPGVAEHEVVEFDSSGKWIIPPGSGFATVKNILLLGLTTNVVTGTGASDVYFTAATGSGISFVSAFGPSPDKWAPPARPPQIQSQYALSVDSDGALVGAAINPRFWSDTRYYAEWGTGECSAGGCPNKTPVPPGTELGTGIVNSPSASKGVLLSGLQPATIYHYRFVAESGGGGPVYGLDPDGTGPEEPSFSVGREATFTTPALPQPPNVPCPNDQFRSGASARLPDCRAYEMVSPVDKNNTDIATLGNVNGNPAALNQSAVAGGKLTYTISQGLADTKGVPYVSQYIAARDAANGWQTEAITPSQGLSPVEVSGRIDVEFRAFTPDLCASSLFHVTVTDPLLAAGAVEGFPNIYLRHDCTPSAGTYTPITTTKPPSTLPKNYSPTIRGLAANGNCVAFSAFDQLSPEANPGTAATQIYETCGESPRLLSVLPDGAANPGNSAVGTIPTPASTFRETIAATAVSADGSRVYWTASSIGPGKVYLRVNAAAEQSKVVAGKCIEAERACTIKVSESASNKEASFWAASEDGSRAFFTVEDSGLRGGGTGKLYEFDLASKGSKVVVGEVSGFLGASADARRAYFLSRAVIGGANGEGKAPTAGKGNLYLFDADKKGADRFRFIATLSAADARTVTLRELTPVNLQLFKKASRVSSSGQGVAFMSTASLTGYDNIDSQSGKADNEVFVYEAAANGGAGELHCVSCNPTGQRPAGREVEVETSAELPTPAAALLPTYETELYGPRVISADGTRVYFESFEALISTDTNGKADVYQWEAPGAGTCTSTSPSFSAPNGGCLDLISSGESATDSHFLDASGDGTDVFFTTDSSLLPQDPGLIDIYDARSGGGYPPPPPPAAPCEGEACQGPSAPPNDPTPGSLTFNGAGNKEPDCARGKVRRKARCVKKKRKKRAHHRQVQRNRGGKR